jgi:hypothetical protein
MKKKKPSAGATTPDIAHAVRALSPPPPGAAHAYCGACRFAAPTSRGDGAVYCRRFPPQIVPGAGVAFPTVHEGWSCGEFAP